MKQICQNGYMTLLSVLIVGAVGLTIAVTLLTQGIGSAATSSVYQKQYQAKSLANACAEEGLEQIRSATTFTGTGNLSLGQGTCSYTVSNQGGEQRTIDATGTVDVVVRKVKVSVQSLMPTIVIASWQEVKDL